MRQVRILLLTLVVVIGIALDASAIEKIQGWCEDGNKTITVGSTTSSAVTPVQRSYPRCTVTVYDAGTVNVATIYADNNATPTAKANPFTAAPNGYWFFYAPNDRYDVRFSGGGIPIPFTLGDFSAFDPQVVDLTNHCSYYAGATGGAKIAACMQALTDGGTADATGIQGAQTITSDIWSGITEQVQLKFGAATYVLSATASVPSNVTLDFTAGGIISVNSGITFTIDGPVVAPVTQIFTGSGETKIRNFGRSANSHIPGSYPQWWGVKGDGSITYSGSMTSGSSTVTIGGNAFVPSDVGKSITVTGALTNSATLVGTIVSYVSPTAVTVSVSANTTATNSTVTWATDDTTAFQKAVDSSDHIMIPPGVYGLTSLRVHHVQKLVGSGPAITILSRIGSGIGGFFIALSDVSGYDAAQRLHLSDFWADCNQIGSNNGGIQLGASNPLAFANNSFIDQVSIFSCSGVGLEVNSNVGVIGQVWIQNHPSHGTPDGLSIPNSKGFVVSDTQIIANLIAVEGRFEAGDFISSGGGGNTYNAVHLEPLGHYPSSDLVTISGTGQTLSNVTVATGSATRRDVVRITGGAQNVRIDQLLNCVACGPPGITATNLLNDTTYGCVVTLASLSFLPWYYSDQNACNYTDQFFINWGTNLRMRPDKGYYIRNVADTDTFRLGAYDINDVLLIGDPTDSGLSIRNSSPIQTHYSDTASLDYGVIGAGACETLSIAVAGAVAGMATYIGATNTFMTTHDFVISAWVSSTSVVAVRVCNPTASPSPDPAAAVFRADVWNH